MASLIHTVDDLLGTGTLVSTTRNPWIGRESKRAVQIYGPKAKLELTQYLKDHRNYFKTLAEGTDTR